MIDQILKNHEEELQKIHKMFNSEIKNIKEYYIMKINNLEMEINEKEMKEYIMKKNLLKIIVK